MAVQSTITLPHRLHTAMRLTLGLALTFTFITPHSAQDKTPDTSNEDAGLSEQLVRST